MSEPAKCPRDGNVLVEVDDGRFLECVCGYKFDAFLSREARYDEWDAATWFLGPKRRVVQRVKL